MIKITNIWKGETLFALTDESLKKNSIPRSSVVAFESDTTDILIGKHNSVLSCVKAMHPIVFNQGYVCHPANLFLMAGVQTLPIDVDDLFVDYYYFDKSAKPKEMNSAIYGSQRIEHRMISWLSLEKCIQHVLPQWSAIVN